MKCHGFGPQLNNGIYNTYFANVYMKRLINTLNLRMRSMYGWPFVDFMGWFTNRKKKYTWFQNVQTHVRTEDGDLPQSYPTLLDRVLMTPFNQLVDGSLINTRLISSKKLRVQQLKFKVKHQTSIDKEYFKPMIKGLLTFIT
jgi:penicillin-binding protein 2